VLQGALGAQSVEHFVAMKENEQEILDAMVEDRRRMWLMGDTDVLAMRTTAGNLLDFVRYIRILI
jgi:hypothetical protein